MIVEVHDTLKAQINGMPTVSTDLYPAINVTIKSSRAKYKENFKSNKKRSEWLDISKFHMTTC